MGLGGNAGHATDLLGTEIVVRQKLLNYWISANQFLKPHASKQIAFCLQPHLKEQLLVSYSWD